LQAKKIFTKVLPNPTLRYALNNKNTIFVLIFVIFGLISGCTPNSVAQISTPVSNSKAGTPTPNGQINIPGVSIQVNAPGPNPLVNKPDTNNLVAGLLMGIWHGIISPFTLIISFIQSGVQMYEVHNDGSQYNLGFLIGVALIFLILGASVGSRRR
jgi:hypothetical protein